ncbi:hypothetical protein T484DRAFT_1961870, partial [Baffinella frigidus]
MTPPGLSMLYHMYSHRGRINSVIFQALFVAFWHQAARSDLIRARKTLAARAYIYPINRQSLTASHLAFLGRTRARTEWFWLGSQQMRPQQRCSPKSPSLWPPSRTELGMGRAMHQGTAPQLRPAPAGRQSLSGVLSPRKRSAQSTGCPPSRACRALPSTIQLHLHMARSSSYADPACCGEQPNGGQCSARTHLGQDRAPGPERRAARRQHAGEIMRDWCYQICRPPRLHFSGHPPQGTRPLPARAPVPTIFLDISGGL